MATAIVAAIGLTGTAAAIATFVINYAISYALNKAFAPDIPEQPKDAGVTSRSRSDTGNKLPVVYGSRKVAGSVIMQDITDDNQTMAFIIALAEGPVSGIGNVYWGDKRIIFTGTGLKSVTGTKTPDQEDTSDTDDFLNDGRFKCRVYPDGGRCKEMEEFSAKWKDYTGDYDASNTTQTNRQMPNIAYAYVELTFNRDKGTTGLPPQLFFTVEGKKIKTITSSNTISTVETASTNPAEVIYDYLTNTTYGCSVPAADIDIPSFYSHKGFCNSTKPYTAPNGTTQIASRYSSIGVLNTNNPADSNISDLTLGNSVSFNWTLGKFGLVTNHVKSSTFSFSEENIYGGIEVTGQGFNSKLNKLTLRYYDKQARELEGQVILEEPSSNLNDNEPLLERTLTFPFTNSNVQAHRSGAILLNQSRQSLIVNFVTDLSALQVQAGDVVSIAHKTPGWPATSDIAAGRTGKLFRILSVDEVINGGAIGLRITAQEYAAAVYDDLSINEYDVASNTNLPNPYRQPLITSLTATEDTGVLASNLVVNWLDGSSTFTDEYLISYKITGSADSTANHKTVSNGQKYVISPLLPSTAYTITVAPVSVTGVKGNSVLVNATTSASRVTGLTSRGAWPTTGTVSVAPGDIFEYSGDLWFYTGTSTISLDAATTNPSADDTANDRWDQVDIPSGANGNSITPIYATSAAGAGQTLTADTAHPYVNFYETATVLTASDLPISGISFAAYLPNTFEKIYINSAGQPTTPTASTTIPSGWSTSVPAPSNVIVWSSEGVKTNGIGNYVWGGAIRETGFSGTDGSSNSIARVYKKQASNLSVPNSADKPNGDLLFTWATGVITGTNFNGWSVDVPVLAEGQTSYIRRAVAYGTGGTDTIETGDWSGASVHQVAPLSATRTVASEVFFTVAQSATPSSPSATSYDFTNGSFVGLTTNWQTSGVTIDASQSNSLWQSTYTITEATRGGTQTLSFATPVKVSTFSNILASGGIAAGQTLKVGDLVTSDTAITSGSGALFEADGDCFVGSADSGFVFDESTGTMTINGTVVTAGNITIDGTTLISSGGTLKVGAVNDSQIIVDFEDLGNISTVASNTNVSNSYTKQVRIGDLDTSGGVGDQDQGVQGTAASSANVTISTTKDIYVSGELSANGGYGRYGGTSTPGTTYGDNGGNGGNISLTSTTGDVYLEYSCFARGGIGGGASSSSASNTIGIGGDGGAAGNITISADLGNIHISRTDFTGLIISAKGGDGGSVTFSQDTSGDGGAGGTITLYAPNGCISVTGTEASGDGATGSQTLGIGTAGTGGTGGSISKTNSAGNACN